MKHFRRATLFVVGLALAATLTTPAVAARPNVIVFLADDAGWGDYSHNGNTNIRTPNIDSIATGGAKFDRFYVCAVCAPTRAEFLTGRYHPRGGVRGVSTGQERLNLDERTVADAFKAAGYATGAFGKWHNGSQWPYHPQARGFDEYYGHTSGHWGEYFDPPIEHNGKMIREKGYIVDLCTDKAIDFINRNQEKPFFCYVPFTTPHSPWAVPDSFWQRFRTKPIGLRATDPAQEVDEHTRCALAMVEQQDWNVGRVLRRLDELKLTENTIIAYFSDNGPNSSRWTGGMKGRKGSVDEGGVRSPLILRWPARIAPGTMVREITGAIDLLPTLTSLAGVKRVGDKPLDGLDLTPLLLGQKWQRPERFLFNVQNNSISVRSQQYRLDPQGALFDMVADPGQTKNVASEKSDVAASMAKALADWRASIPGAAKAPEPSAATAKAGKNKGGKGGGGGTLLPPDDRAYTVGYREFPWTPLPARDGVPNGGVQRSSGAPNSSYFVNWKSKDDSMTWDIEVNSTGNYEVVIDYTAAEAGATLELEFRAAKLAGKVAPAWNPPLYTNQDTIARPPAESQMKEFRPLNLGIMRLEKGRGQLTLRATDIPGASVMDVRRVNLTLK